MSGWSPPTLSKKQLTVILLAVGASIAYSVGIAAQWLLALGPITLLLVLYLFWRLIRAIEAIAEASQRIADTKEGEKR